MFHRLIIVVGCVLLAGTMFVPLSRADEWNKKTIVTFNEPVEVPGVVLPAGTYVFQLLDSDSNRDIVQIFNRDQTKVFATILAIPDYRMNTTGKTVITFDERPKGSPEALDAWFYPGDNYGIEFVHPRERATLIASANNRPVLAHEASPQAKPAELKTTPVKAINPAGQEIEVAKVVKPPKPAATEMPHTASDLPLMIMLGVLCLGLALALPRMSRVIS